MPAATFADVAGATRVVVLGASGAGKTTAARRLAQALGDGTVAIDFDDLRWAPAEKSPWTQRSEERVRQLAREAVRDPRWVMAAVDRCVADDVLAQADVAIYLDYSPRVTLRRLTRRTISRMITKDTCCNGNKESLRSAFGSDSLFRWWFRTFRDRHEHALEMESLKQGVPTLRLTAPKQFEELMGQVG